MIYRRKMYRVSPRILEDFNLHFNKTLLPTQLKYGSRLVGRWMTNETNGEVDVFAIWEYDSYEEYERIEAAVRSDEAHMKRVQDWYGKWGGRENLKEHFYKIDQDFINNTVTDG
jgi:NIPSNAP